MGFITSMARRMRNNKLSRRLSSTQPRRGDESKDLIKSNSETVSFAQAESIESTSTIVHHSSHDVVQPSELPARKRLQGGDVKIQTLFDGIQTPDSVSSRTAKTLSRPEYPILKLDTVHSPHDTPTKKLQGPIETEEKLKEKDGENKGSSTGSGCSEKENQDGNEKEKKPSQVKKGSAAKNRRSMTAMLRDRCSVKMPRSSLSLKSLRSPSSPKWLDGHVITEDESPVEEMSHRKWGDKHSRKDWGRGMGVWGVGLMGRAM
ncbi:hypothetical protein NUU61_002089 [Penicillium alfredii]|uniref:Uncharacterized protein n=1 Tax=Penicillium alfredii TaxID=1506179 RepID=A0A9W9FR00_9EURO|nr:uncharacterized protein NUU61_002089 [Penicillium alfredii]KAJ5104742.1 hypothetical protein NUU61_002089 [Penicillium alfredii]